ncbi:hypothetical protein LPB67_16690 [Undibacterium sp. Jales W-56]|uniref:hypothetical protein n=1 Tax=Undibacterium sp. Jales W-56 TaxID=2897325 RepID=UPI0021CFF51C|nr:hypothetical protein [Undibacterium sp. Jales W-56]MCU6435416.1 hypothetical protein [Undibacterium sp. Jales W-56]
MRGSRHSNRQQPEWQTAGSGQRLASAALAGLISIFMLVQLNQRPGLQVARPSAEIQVNLLRMELRPWQTTQQPVEKQHISAPPPKNRKRITAAAAVKSNSATSMRSTPATNTPASSPEPIAITGNATPLFSKDALAMPGLEIDSQAIGRAYKNSRSEIQQMADSSAKEMNTPVATRYEQFQAKADKAKIQDCIKPMNIPSVNLLLIPVIAYAAATGKCK